MEPCYDIQRYVDTVMHHEANASNFRVVWVYISPIPLPEQS